ncbi:glutamate receptor 2 isoform X1 [Nasonia vitripennis]|uniref:Ionotropic glutamate receptor C-terminal domain-containing protein n=2 Tax=Nasonia vitripennis TaxID=7425 RepID=A0A7M7QAM4_NASVI|nr:glutamate receptor 2 isoform X1 [Nasonia vitripennis]XP_031783535.1 glutamate receptor 2 isoform X1 [Nasonia vitripennis]XP_031783536.1 glutamate receptor 2 isoform X1 [Nasonia vitripennis]XP_031783537.1 glutamate receptor 2 isoform X1 [Nasonia vitripennis]XP_031783538.1 glutamate receptor 2 isoform X1 [Nasonia vitripennis]XP_031783539.1 glutamate receptor 2 isoform X1 [Nasonia vitripennis]
MSLVLLLLLCYLSTLLSAPATSSKTSDTGRLARLLEYAGPLYSGAFSMVTSFSCSDVDGRFELLRDLSRIQVGSNVLDLEKSVDRLSEIAWEKGYAGQNEIPSDAHRVLFTLDLDCPKIDDFIRKADREYMFAAPFKWLLTQRSNDTDDLVSRFAEVGAYPDSEVTVWQKETGQLLSIYRTNGNNDHLIEDRGSWMEEDRRMLVGDTNVTSRRRKNLGGIGLKSCLVITDPNTIHHLDDYHDKHIDTITKCNYPWVLILMNMLNATVTFEPVGSWGYKGPNGSWDGMIGMLQRGEIDFGGTGCFLTPERMGAIQYISLPTPTRNRFIFRRPPLSSVSNLFKLPFGNSVWFGSCALVIILITMLYPAMKHEWMQFNEVEKAREPIPPNLSDDLLVIVGAVSQQGSWYEPRSVSTRIIVLFGLLAALNLYAAYTANIVALLQSTTGSIKTLQDLLDSPLMLAAHDNVYNRYYFKSFKDPIRRTIFEERIEPRTSKKTNWLTIEDGIEKLRGGYFAFHVELGPAYKLIQERYEEDEKCGFQEIDYLNVFYAHLVVRRRSPYLELLRVGAMRLYETGMRTKDINRLYTRKPECGGSSSRRFLSVGLAECYGAFSTLGYGLALALGVLIAEVVSTKLKVRCKSSQLSSTNY